MPIVIDRSVNRAEVVDSNRRITKTWWTLFTGLFALIPIDVVLPLNFPNTAAQTSSDIAVAIRGAKLGDFATVSAPVGSILANSLYWAFVSDVDEVKVRFCNFSAGALNPASGDFTVRVKRGN